MQTLLLDIETTPNLADVWGLWNQNVSLNQLRQSTELLCFSAKWLGQPDEDAEFWSGDYDPHTHAGTFGMIRAAHTLLNEADAVIHYNGRKFDIPHLNREFLEGGLTPPAPYKQIDLCDVAKKVFRFPSNKLQYVSKAVGLDGKVQHEGHELWTKCMAGDPAAWLRMEKYNVQDVNLLDGLYRKLQPWVPNHPSHAVYFGADICPKCGDAFHLQKRGWAYTQVSVYRRYQCQSCGGWSRGTKREHGVTITGVANA